MPFSSLFVRRRRDSSRWATAASTDAIQLVALDAHAVADAQSAGLAEIEAAQAAVVERDRDAHCAAVAARILLDLVAEYRAADGAGHRADVLARAAAAQLAADDGADHATHHCAGALRLVVRHADG